jgi:hypothetical protein
MAIVVDNLSQHITMLQYLIEMGMKGSHVLFTPEEIKQAFNRDINELLNVDNKTIIEVNKAIQDVMEIKDIEDKKDYLKGLNPLLRDIIIHLYFQMIDRTMFQANIPKH